jgi:(1->4)-alpha-D-glucan 1-alpha-D-glucosylmutase
VCAFPVYRTYLRLDVSPSTAAERVVRSAVRLARFRNPAQNPSVFAFFEKLLLLRLEGGEELKRLQSGFALRFQQLSGPIMAKAVEDTAFYRYVRLVCLNEVGGSPARLGAALRDFHRDNQERARSWPLSMVTTATHDTKRGEDAAARIAVLSEMPELWARTLERWREIAGFARAVVDDAPAPSAALEYLFYQTLVGAWPFGASPSQLGNLESRLAAYLLKAAREAKLETSWLTCHAEYEAGLQKFVHKLFRSQAFLSDVGRFCAELDMPAAVNGLAQVLLRTCCPGVPDTYQGGELWNQSLVDPDNRQPVDYELRRKYLNELTSYRDNSKALASKLLESFADGRVKQYVLYRALQLRQQKPELFARGDYLALDGGEHVVAFMRTFETDRVVCVTPRLSRKLCGRAQFPVGSVWGGQVLRGVTPGRYRELFSGAQLELDATPQLADLLRDFPLALLVAEGT